MSLELTGVEKNFGAEPVLRGVSLRVEAGELTALLGANGSGKTTTLRIAAGFLHPDTGTVRIDGEELASHPELAARIGYLPERPPLYDALTVKAFLRFVARAKSVPAAKQRSAISKVAEACALGPLLAKRIGRLSKGQRQRVGLAQALLADPAVLLLDEATSGLDPLQVHEARATIRDDSEKRATLFSTHLLGEAAALCSRVLVLDRGRIAASHEIGSDRPSWFVALRGVTPERAEALLREVPGVTGVESVEAAALAFRCEARPGEDVAAALATAVTARAELLELRPARINLEEVFERATAGSP